MTLSFFIAIKTVSEANAHEHWRKRQQRARSQRNAACINGYAACDVGKPALPLVVHLTRVSARELDDDNLQGALKHIRDGIADWLGVDDRKRELVRYEYGQERGKTAGVRVEVRPMEAAAKTG